MAVDYEHRDYCDNIDKWKRCEIVSKGQDSVHESGPIFLPRLSDQTDNEYNAYLRRTPFFNATRRTIAGLVGMIFRKPPVVKVPESVEKMMEDVTLDGTPLHLFALRVSEEVLKVGRVGIFTDYPEVPETATKADALAENHRPTLKFYKASSIINWKTRIVKNKILLSMVVLKEVRDIPVDEFEDKEEVQYRVLDLFEIDEDLPAGVVKRLVYRVRVIIIKEANGKKEEVTLSTSFPKIDGAYIEEIPFHFVSVDRVTWEINEPPLIDLVNINLSHYRTAADYEHGCHFTGLPTPVITGHETEKDENGNDQRYHIGSMTAWVFRRPEAKASFLEFKGEGLNALKDNMDRKEKQMAVLGARMLEVSRSNGVESANTAAIHRSGEQSMLACMAQALSIAITKALKTFTWFAGGDESDVSFELNRDFFPVPMDSLELTALVAAWQNGAIDYETLVENLQKGEIVRMDVTPEELQKRIKENPAPLAVAGTTPGNPTPNAPKTAAGGTENNPTIKQMQTGKTTSS